MRVFFAMLVVVLLSGLLFFIPKSKGNNLSLDIFNKIVEEDFPIALDIENATCFISYTFDNDLETFIKKMLKKNMPDYSAVVVIDNGSGEVLALVGGVRNGEFNRYFPLSSTHPAASLIKIITTAALLETNLVNANTSFSYSGKGTTLYKRQINSIGKIISLYEAFAKSNNAVLAGAALKYLNPLALYKMAEKFYFNKQFSQDIQVGSSSFAIPENEFHMAELASGFNRNTMISPYHGAVIGSIIANDGILQYPSIIKEIICNDEIVWKSKEKSNRIISKNIAKGLRGMMKGVVSRGGTAGGTFRSSKKLFKLEIGGKTGSMTGGIPHGKNDWFVSFAIPRGESSGVSIAVLHVDVDKWRMKSFDLTRTIMEYYFSRKNYDQGN